MKNEKSKQSQKSFQNNWEIFAGPKTAPIQNKQSKLKGKSVRLELNWELPFIFRLETKYLDWGEWNRVKW